jgi:hypothetical protein
MAGKVDMLAGRLTSDANGVHQQVILYNGSGEIVWWRRGWVGQPAQ